jgi:hypothetical protein
VLEPLDADFGRPLGRPAAAGPTGAEAFGVNDFGQDVGDFVDAAGSLHGDLAVAVAPERRADRLGLVRLWAEPTSERHLD